MKRLIVCLSLAILSCNYVPAIANTTNSTKIGISVVVKEKIPCQFEFSAESKNGSREYSHVDSFNCANSSKKLLEAATKVARQTTQDTDSNRVRVVMTVE